MSGVLLVTLLVIGGFVVWMIVTAVFERLAPRRLLRLFQRYNSPLYLPFAGLAPGWAVIETMGRRTGKPHRVPVGGRLQGQTLWLVAGSGRHAEYVRNIELNSKVRVRRLGRWREGVAYLCDEDNPRRRLLRLNPINSVFVWIAGRELLTVRIDLTEDSQRVVGSTHPVNEGQTVHPFNSRFQRTVSRVLRLRLFRALIVVFVFGSACASDSAVPFSTSTPEERASSGDALGVAQWALFEIPELGVTFDFRPGAGTVTYRFDQAPDDTKPCADGGTDGAIAVWELAASAGQPDDPSGVFAWATSKGFGPDSGDSILSRDRWLEGPDGTKRVISCGMEHRVESFGVYDLAGGARGLVYAPGVLGEPPVDPKERAAIVNLPSGYNARFHSINFAFFRSGRFSQADIERVLRSIRLKSSG